MTEPKDYTELKDLLHAFISTKSEHVGTRTEVKVYQGYYNGTGDMLNLTFGGILGITYNFNLECNDYESIKKCIEEEWGSIQDITI